MDEATAEGDGEQRARRRRVAWFFGVLAFLFVAVAFGVWKKFDWAHATIASHRERLPAERAALAARQRGRPALLEPAAPGEAGAVVRAFVAALAAVPEPEREKVVGGAEEPVPQEEIDAVLAAHPEVIAALQPLPATSSVPRVPSGPDASAVLFDQTRGGPKWLWVAADRALVGGDARASARISVLLAVWGNDVARDGTWVSSLVGASLEGVGHRRLVAALAAGIDEGEARWAGAVLRGLEATRVSPGFVLEGERVSFRGLLVSPSAVGREARPGWRRLWSTTIYQAEALDGLDDVCATLAAASEGSERDARAAIARVKALPEVEHAILQGFQRVVPIWIERRETARAWGLVAATACAVSEATSRRGALPKSLEELVPEFLPAVPIDPWSGKPLRYEDGRVWSLGSDGVDDGGKPADLEEDRPADLAARVPAPR